LGSAGVNAAGKTLMKLTPGVDLPTFYEQLLREQIPKVQKDTNGLTVFCAFGICLSKSCA